MAWRELSDDAQHWAFWGGLGLAVIAAIAAGAYWNWWSYLWNVPPPIRALLTVQAVIGALVLWFLLAFVAHRYFGWPHPFYRPIASGQLVIHSAQYGIGGKDYQDVVTLLEGHVESNRIDTTLSNALFPPHDPFPGKPKHLVVVYSIGNGPRTRVVCHEGKRLQIPQGSGTVTSNNIDPLKAAVFVGRIVPNVALLSDEYYLDLTFSVFNGTGHDLAIDVHGSLICNEQPAKMPASIPDTPTPLGRRREIVVTIRQYFRPDDALTLKTAVDSEDGLSITFSDLHIVGRLGQTHQWIVIPLPDGITVRPGLMVGEIFIARVGGGNLNLSGGLGS